MAVEKNIAALLREDARTIRVMFSNFNREGLVGKFDDEVLPAIGAYAVQAQAADPNYEVAGQGGYKFYPYVTHFDHEIGDLVLVEAAGQLKVAQVMEIDDGVQIEPGSQYALRWVICGIDLASHKDNMAKNDQIEQLVQEAYKANLRKSFRNQILAGLEGAEVAGLTKLLGGA
jgi:hypothetical protein